MTAILGEMAALAALGVILAGAVIKAAETHRVRIRAGAKKNQRR